MEYCCDKMKRKTWNDLIVDILNAATFKSNSSNVFLYNKLSIYFHLEGGADIFIKKHSKQSKLFKNPPKTAINSDIIYIFATSC